MELLIRILTLVQKRNNIISIEYKYQNGYYQFGWVDYNVCITR